MAVSISGRVRVARFWVSTLVRVAAGLALLVAAVVLWGYLVAMVQNYLQLGGMRSMTLGNWLSLLLNILSGPGITAAAGLLGLRFRQGIARWLVRPDLAGCPECGYALTGGGTCPECGTRL